MTADETRLLHRPLQAGIILLALLPLGLLGRLDPRVLALVLIPHLFLLLDANRAALRLIHSLSPKGPWNRIVGPMVLIFLGFALCAGAVPVTAKDALVHHIAVPQWWLQNGRITEIPWHEWSYYPMGPQLGFLTVIGLIGDRWCAAYHALYLLPLCAVTGMLVQRTTALSSRAATYAVLIMASLPVILRLASEPMVDLPLALYCTIGLVLLLAADLTWRSAALAGLSFGLAYGAKLSSLMFVGMCGLALPFLIARPSQLLRQGLVLLLWFLLAASPWLFKSFALTGNPIYPLYNNLFVANDQRPHSEGGSGVSVLMHRREIYGESYTDLLLTPLRMALIGEDDNPRRFDGVLSPILLFAILGFWRLRKSQQAKYVLLVTIGFFVLAQFSALPRIRYLSPILAPLCAMAGIGLAVTPLVLGNLIIAAQVIFGLTYAVGLIQKRDAIGVLSGRVSPEEYLATREPGYSVITYINEKLPVDARVYLVLEGNRFSLFKRSVESSGFYSGQELTRWLERDTVLEELFKRGCAYLFIGEMRYMGEGVAEETKNRWSEFKKQHLISVANDQGYALYKLQ